jgi:hypothetical protein
MVVDFHAKAASMLLAFRHQVLTPTRDKAHTKGPMTVVASAATAVSGNPAAPPAEGESLAPYQEFRTHCRIPKQGGKTCRFV